ncbi:thiamine-phosphate diphosphorylase [Legionella quinlivanii]|uniref:Thiamine-phosphate synthase n=1 Tax=Legionella quinlivanii TaxID=45073 RepID=A0A364LFA7_9GAMM|nr:thiamine phosphate synthase [Legionella quinlivanii]RAP34533.1 thiamine-phosphate diphosphorylase [Legionella quinlivanii]
MISALKYCYITDYSKPSLLFSAIKGGVLSVQYREKNLSFKQHYQKAKELKYQLDRFRIPLIINDDVLLAQEIGAAGVHLGQLDQSPEEARCLLGSDKLIGLSIESIPQLEAANHLDCLDYVAASAVFKSRSKQDVKTLWELDGLAKLVQLSRHPVIAIGGINLGNVSSVMSQGAFGVAVIAAISDADNPEGAAKSLHRLILGVNYA